MSDSVAALSTPPTAEEHMINAENFLAIAEDASAEASTLHAERVEIHARREEGDDLDALESRFWRLHSQADDRFEKAAVLAELHRKMALAIWTQPQKLDITHSLAQIGAPDWATLVDKGVPNPLAPEQQLREQVAADVAEHQAETLNPNVDPEPAGSEGDLFTLGEGWFLYATNGHASPGDRKLMQYAERWLLIRHYAQFLRWRDEKATKPNPLSWDELYQALSEHGEPVLLRRPTHAERTAFYGPEPDPAPPECGCCTSGLVADAGIDPHTTICGLCDHTVVQHARRVPEQIVPAARAWLPSDHPRPPR